MGAVYVRTQRIDGLFGNDMTDLKDSWGDAESFQPLSSKNENTSDGAKQCEADRDCRTKRPRNREGFSRKPAESLSTFTRQNMITSKSSLNRRGPLRSISSGSLVAYQLLSANQLMVRCSSERIVWAERPEQRVKGEDDHSV